MALLKTCVLLLGLIWPMSLWADFDFEEWDEAEEQLPVDIEDVQTWGSHHHYQCFTSRIASQSFVDDDFTYLSSEVEEAQGQFELIYSEAYDIPMQTMYGIIEDDSFKKWFLIYGSFNEYSPSGEWVKRQFDLHSLIKVPQPLIEDQQGDPLDVTTPYHFQAFSTKALTEVPWESQVQDPVIYAGGTVAGFSQMGMDFLADYNEDSVREMQTTYMVFKAPQAFAHKRARPDYFVGELSLTMRDAFLEGPPRPHRMEVYCHLQSDMDENDFAEILKRSMTFDISQHLSEDWDFEDAGEVYHFEGGDGSSGVGSFISNNLAQGPLLSMAELIVASNRHLHIMDSSNWTNTLTALGAASLSYLLFRGANVGLAGARTHSFGLPFWAGSSHQDTYWVPSHPEHSLEEVIRLSRQIIESGGQIPAQTPESLLIYSQQVEEAISQAQIRVWWTENCEQNPQNCS
jgi:hypothetical protein